SLLGCVEVKLQGNERQSNTRHEDDHAFEEFARRCEPPDAPLHCGDRYRRYYRAIGPVGTLIDVFLNCLPSRFAGHASSLLKIIAQAKLVVQSEAGNSYLAVRCA